jgi:hypothetical protein
MKRLTLCAAASVDNPVLILRQRILHEAESSDAQLSRVDVRAMPTQIISVIDQMRAVFTALFEATPQAVTRRSWGIMAVDALPVTQTPTPGA